MNLLKQKLVGLQINHFTDNMSIMLKTENLQMEKITKSFISSKDPKRLLLTVVIVSLILGVLTGLFISNKSNKLTSSTLGTPAKNPQADTRTFRDFAEGVVKLKPQTSGNEYAEGTHVLEREGAVPVALTSSVVDLSKYEGKKIKVFGETQKALKEGWLMDVGKVEEIK